MADAPRRPDPRQQAVVLRIPGMDDVRVQRDVVWRVTDSGPLHLDLYLPRDTSTRPPLVILVAGYPDPGFRAVVGCPFKETGQNGSWGRLAAASGLAAVAYENREPADVHELVAFVRESGESLGVDASRLAIYGCSGNGPTALSVLMSPAALALRCAVFCCAYLVDVDGATGVADASKAFGFLDACTGKSAADLPSSLPLFVARGGRDSLPGLNDSLDRFAAAALARNLPLTLVNHAEGVHAFELSDESEAARDVVRQMLAFMRRHLLG